VYRQFKPSLTTRREDVPVIHELHGTRYNPSSKEVRLSALNAELRLGATAVAAWARESAPGAPHQLEFAVETVECC